MIHSIDRAVQTDTGLLGAAGLVDRLLHIPRRKRAFGGQVVDMESIRQHTEEVQRRNRGR
jgi:hypothetical protein